MQANGTSENSKRGLPMKSHRLKQHLADGTYQISVHTDGEIGKECLSITTLQIPYEEYGWPIGGEISIPLPLVPKFKELLVQWEAAMGGIGVMDQNEPLQDSQVRELNPATCQHEGQSRTGVHQISL